MAAHVMSCNNHRRTVSGWLAGRAIFNPLLPLPELRLCVFLFLFIFITDCTRPFLYSALHTAFLSAFRSSYIFLCYGFHFDLPPSPVLLTRCFHFTYRLVAPNVLWFCSRIFFLYDLRFWER